MAEGTASTGGPKMLDASDTEDLKAFLMKGVASFHESHEVKMTPSTYMDLYTAVSKLTVRQRYEDGVFLGDDIYNDVSKFLVKHLEVVKRKIACEDESARLGTYFAEWDRYNSSAIKVDRILNLLNRHYILRNTSEGRKGFYPIRLLHYVHWRSEVWENVSDLMVDCAKKTIQKSEAHMGRVYDMIRDFEDRGDDSHVKSWEERIGKSFEFPFVIEVERLEREVDEIAAGFVDLESHSANG